MTITIYHNPACGTSRNVLGLIRNSSQEPPDHRVPEDPAQPRGSWSTSSGEMGITPRGLLRRKGTPYDELGLDDPTWTDDELIDQMLAHPILINRPIVVTPLGVEALPAVRGGPGHPARPAARALLPRRTVRSWCGPTASGPG